MKFKPVEKTTHFLKRYFFILLGSVLAGACYSFPLQHHMSLGRYQHYGFALFLFGMGYVMHTIWMWKRSRTWTRACQAASGLFFCSVGVVFYNCPWLDPKASIMTDSQMIFRAHLIQLYLVATLILMVLWLISIVDERRHEALSSQ